MKEVLRQEDSDIVILTETKRTEFYSLSGQYLEM